MWSKTGVPRDPTQGTDLTGPQTRSDTTTVPKTDRDKPRRNPSMCLFRHDFGVGGVRSLTDRNEKKG